jgi:hypothetical protein
MYALLAKARKLDDQELIDLVTQLETLRRNENYLTEIGGVDRLEARLRDLLDEIDRRLSILRLFD